MLPAKLATSQGQLPSLQQKGRPSALEIAKRLTNKPIPQALRKKEPPKAQVQSVKSYLKSAGDDKKPKQLPLFKPKEKKTVTDFLDGMPRTKRDKSSLARKSVFDKKRK